MKDEKKGQLFSFFILPPSFFHKHWSSSGQDTAFVMRRRGFESHPVLSDCDGNTPIPAVVL